jgi:hypothetical protein
MPPPRWLLLAHQLPTRHSNARVKTWRRLQQIGAVAARNSVYVLPNTDECREDFEWMRTEIVALGGEATVFAADALEVDGSEAIVALFRKSRDADYVALQRDAERLIARVVAKRAGPRARREQWTRIVRAVRQRFTDVERIDFFDAPARGGAALAIATLERRVAEPDRETGASREKILAPSGFQKRRWVTRPRPGVDRMASAWLIGRFIDLTPRFAFGDRATGSDVAFDMYSGPFSHHGGLCTFEVIARRFGLTDPAVVRIGQIVHDLDLKDSRYGQPDAVTVGRMVEGLRRSHVDDSELLQHGIALFEALARSFESSPGRGAPGRGARTRPSRKKKM